MLLSDVITVSLTSHAMHIVLLAGAQSGDWSCITRNRTSCWKSVLDLWMLLKSLLLHKHTDFLFTSSTQRDQHYILCKQIILKISQIILVWWCSLCLVAQLFKTKPLNVVIMTQKLDIIYDHKHTQFTLFWKVHPSVNLSPAGPIHACGVRVVDRVWLVLGAHPRSH